MKHAPLTVSEYKPRFFIYRWPLVVATFFALASGNAQRSHALVFRLLQPLLHSSESLAAAFQLAPGLRVSQQVGKCSLRAAKHSLREDCLRDRVALQFGGDFSGDGLRVYLKIELAKVKNGK